MRIKLLNTLFTMAALNYETQWLPWTLLHPETELSKYAVVLLNTPISWKPEFLVPFWNKGGDIQSFKNKYRFNKHSLSLNFFFQL